MNSSSVVTTPLVEMFCHMARQVSIRDLRVTFSAYGADVGLKMLGLLMLWDMLQETRLRIEAFVAGVALVGLVSHVTPRMTL